VLANNWGSGDSKTHTDYLSTRVGEELINQFLYIYICSGVNAD